MDALLKAEREFVDELAVYYENQGLSPIAGRIIGRLLVARPEQQSSKELAAYIGASKGSISAQTQFLIEAGFLSKVRRSGSRETWYKLKEDVWLSILYREAQNIGLAKSLADGVVEAQEKAGVTPGMNLLEYRDIMRFFERRMPALIEEWKDGRSEG